MTPEEIQARIQYHSEQAQRLLAEHPLVREFNYYYQQITALNQQLAQAKLNQQLAQAKAVEKPAPKRTRTKRKV